MSHLQLSLTDYQDETRWRWVLSDANGQFLADHEVQLDRQEPKYQGFADLYTYVKTYTLPTYPMEQVLEDVGEWMGQQVFGGLLEVLREERDHAGMVTVVQVRVPKKAQDLLFRPFELAYLDGEPFAQCGIRFVYQLVDGRARSRKGKQEESNQPLRVLAVFSLPDQASPLNLRRERYGLAQLVDQLRQTRGAAVEWRVIQYGATRKTLKEAFRQGGSWDVIHLSGHGLSGQLMLEDSEGKPDIIQADELVKWLRPTRPRLKLLTLSACLSGAGSLQQAHAMLGLSSEQERTRGVAASAAQETRLPSLAQELSQALGCAALAMRYPVGDSFAIVLALELYRSLFNDDQPLPYALQIALSDALEADAKYALSPSPLSQLTPILFGAQATDLLLTPPLVQGQYELPKTGLFRFPEEPERFVGRMLPMLRASQALAPRSDHHGVLFYGMAGAGKTTCALELAYRHEVGRFQGYVWFKAPDEGHEIVTALGNFLQSIESQLDIKNRGILLTHLDDPSRFKQDTLPRLQGMLKQRATLIVIDNIESLLTESGEWRDAKWEALVDALLTRTGASRLVLTSRRQPTALEQQPNLLRLSIHALSLRESLLLARELEHLRLLFGEETGRALLQRTLNMAQGHPKLLELADKMAATGQLATLSSATSSEEASGVPKLTAIEGTQRLDAFFDTGESQQSTEDFVATLRHWTTTLMATLSPTARLLFYFLCRLEEEDRQRGIIETNWEDFLKRLAPTPTPPPTSGEGLSAIPTIAATALNLPNLGLNDTLTTLTNAGLIESRILSGTTSAIRHFRIHSAIAETGRDEAHAIVQEACDIELGNFWYAVARHGERTEIEGNTPLIVTSARRSTPYLLRRERWEEASTLLEYMIVRDQTPATLAFALPLLRQIAATTQGTEREALDKAKLASALLDAGRYTEAEPLLRETMTQSVAQGNYRSASVRAGRLGDLLRMMGRYDEALLVAEQAADYTRRAGLGPWTQLSNETRRLQILSALGGYDEVLKQVNALRPQLATLPDKSGVDESVNPWNVREVILNIGCQAAQQLEEWQTALDLNAELLAYTQKRGADKVEVARTRFNDSGPLLRLHRYVEARALLMHCRVVAEQANQIAELGRVLIVLADLEDKVGNRAAAVPFSQSALRYAYQASDPEDSAISHNNLANHLERDGATANLVLAHRLAAVTINYQTNSGYLAQHLYNLANSPMPASPPTFDEVVATVEVTSGVRFRELFARLPKRAPNGDAAIAAVWEMAKKRQQEIDREFEPLLHDIAAVTQGNEAQRAEIEAFLPQLKEKGWELTASVQRIWAGERDADTLTTGIDAGSARLVRRILELIE